MKIKKIIFSFLLAALLLRLFPSFSQPILIKYNIPGSITVNIGGNIYFSIADSLFMWNMVPDQGILVATAGEHIREIYPLTLGSNFFFVTSAGPDSSSLWTSDGITIDKIGTFKSIAPLFVFKSELYLAIDDGITGLELWKLDSSLQTFSQIKDIAPGPETGLMSIFQNSYSITDSAFYFIAKDEGLVSQNFDIWKSDGTASGTEIVVELPEPPNLTAQLVSINNAIYYAITNDSVSQLWRISDATVLVDEIPGAVISQIAALDDEIYFTYHTPDGNGFLAKSNGAGMGSEIIKRFQAENSLIFTGDDYLVILAPYTGLNPVKIYRSDGTGEGTILLYTPNELGDIPVIIGNFLLFSDDTGAGEFANYELHRTDLTTGSTKLVPSILHGQRAIGVDNLKSEGGILLYETESPAPDFPVSRWYYDPYNHIQGLPSFTLVNADTDQDIQWLDNEEVIIVFPETGINVRFNPAEDAESVVFHLNGKRASVENSAPFSLAGDANGNYHAWNQAAAGTYELTAIPYSGNGGTGTPGTPLTITFTIRDAPGSVIYVSLVNADTDSVLGIINDGDTIDLSTLPTDDLNIAAITEGNVSKVVFDYDGIIKQENQTPYALFGDNMGDFHGKDLNTGTHHLVVTPYSEGNIAGDALAITFYVINETSNARASANGSGAHTGIHVGPNPSSGVFNVVIHSAPAGTNQVEIFRLDGSLVKEVFNGNLNEGQEVNLSWEGIGNVPGIYLLKYTTESSQTVTKIVLGQ